jgi:hypothetical protein
LRTNKCHALLVVSTIEVRLVARIAKGAEMIEMTIGAETIEVMVGVEMMIAEEETTACAVEPTPDIDALTMCVGQIRTVTSEVGIMDRHWIDLEIESPAIVMKIAGKASLDGIVSLDLATFSLY